MAIKRITTNLIEDGSIGTIDIANNAITAAKITDGNITTAKLADLNVTAGKLAGTLDLTGKTITVATATTGDNDTSPASTAFVQQEIAALVDSSPSSLNTLNELAAALGDDASFSTTVTNSIATKLPLAGGTMTGNLKVGATIASTGGTTNNRGMLLAHQNNTNQSYVGRSENGVADTGNRITFDYDNNKMQLDSDGDIILTPTSNVGIGETNPDASLHITSNTPIISFDESDASQEFRIGSFGGSFAIYDSTDSAYRFVVDGSGNVAIGSTSDALDNMSGLFRILDSTGGDRTVAHFGAHNYGDTGKTFINIGSEYGDGTSRIGSFNDTGNKSVLVFDTHSATSGQFTERMRINSSGQVGIACTDQSNPLTVDAKSASTTADSISVRNSGVATGNHTTGLRFQFNSAVSAAIRSRLTNTSSGAGTLSFYTSGDGSAANLAERMTIDSSGNVGIGETSPAKLGLTGSSNGKVLHLGGDDCQVRLANSILHHDNSGNTICHLRNNYGATSTSAELSLESGYITFNSGTSFTERMRIDSYGDVLIGMTANDVAQENGAFIQSANGRYFCSLGSNSLNTYHVYSTVNNSYNFYVNCSGTIYSTSTSISSLSDERLKENIVDIDTGLTEVMSLKPRKFDWKDGNGKDIKNDTGFIAQEVETVLPDLIDDFIHDDLDDAKSIKMGDMIPTLVKAIQEQQTIIDDLKSRIETLEG
jgi:hypothetical protein